MLTIEIVETSFYFREKKEANISRRVVDAHKEKYHFFRDC